MQPPSRWIELRVSKMALMLDDGLPHIVGMHAFGHELTLSAGNSAALQEQGSAWRGKANKAQFLAQCKGLVATLFASVPSPPTTPQPAAGGTPTQHHAYGLCGAARQHERLHSSEQFNLEEMRLHFDHGSGGRSLPAMGPYRLAVVSLSLFLCFTVRSTGLGPCGMAWLQLVAAVQVTSRAHPF